MAIFGSCHTLGIESAKPQNEHMGLFQANKTICTVSDLSKLLGVRYRGLKIAILANSSFLVQIPIFLQIVKMRS